MSAPQRRYTTAQERTVRSPLVPPLPLVKPQTRLLERVGKRRPGYKDEPVSRPCHRDKELASLCTPPFIPVSAVLQPERLYRPVATPVSNEQYELELESLTALEGANPHGVGRS